MGEVMTVGSLFSGIGGLELGLERAGMKTAWQVEMDDYASKVLERHWPDALRFRDVRGVGAYNLPPVDLICGGFPCQDISLAGKGAGLAGERSGLWFEFARIVRELRPRYVLVENVAALLARGLGQVLGDLAACGYDAEWDCIPAAAVGAHHRRDRLFIVAYAERDALRQQPEPELRRSGAALVGQHGAFGDVADAECSEGSERHDAEMQRGRAHQAEQARMGGGGAADPHAHGERLAERTEPDREPEAGRETFLVGRDAGGFRDALADADRELRHRSGRARGRRTESADRSSGLSGGDARAELAAAFRGSRSGAGIWATEPDVGRVADGIPSRVDRLRCLGNAVVPQVAEFIGRRIVAMEARYAHAA